MMIAIPAVLVSSALYSAAFPPFDLWVTAWFALVPLLFGLARVRPAAGFALGVLWGLGVGAGTAFFLPGMIERYFELGSATALVAALAAIAVPALACGCFGGWLSARVRGVGVGPFEIAAAWGLTEFARTTEFLPNPWALSGYSQSDWLIPIQAAELVGVLGVGMGLALVNAALAAVLTPSLRSPNPGRSTALAVTIVVLWLGFGSWSLRQTTNENPMVRIGAIQGAIPRAVRVDETQRARVLETQVELSREVAASQPLVILWPEYALGHQFSAGSAEHFALAGLSHETQSDLLVGALAANEDGTLSNATILIRDGRFIARYDKVLLMPFAETDPVRQLSGISETADPSRRIIRAGTSREPLETRAGAIGVLVCNEIMLGGAARAAVAAGAEILVNPANDDWFGPIGARHQARIARVRAVEMGRALVRSTHSGVTVIYGPNGRIIATEPAGEPGFLVGDVHPSRKLTVYARLGDWPVLICALIGVAFDPVRRLISRRRT